MIDLWTLIVVDMFQSFWMAVLAIAGLMWIIFVIGKVSQVTSLNFLLIFILAMGIGYGYLISVILLTILYLIIIIIPLAKTVNN